MGPTDLPPITKEHCTLFPEPGGGGGGGGAQTPPQSEDVYEPPESETH